MINSNAFSKSRQVIMGNMYPESELKTPSRLSTESFDGAFFERHSEDYALFTG